jgi:hypothetical protein
MRKPKKIEKFHKSWAPNKELRKTDQKKFSVIYTAAYDWYYLVSNFYHLDGFLTKDSVDREPRSATGGLRNASQEH